jgi:hypothetical protein
LDGFPKYRNFPDLTPFLPIMLKKPGQEIVQVPAPCLPLMGGAGREKKDVFDSGFVERFVSRLAAGSVIRFGRSSAQPKQVDLQKQPRISRIHMHMACAYRGTPNDAVFFACILEPARNTALW